MTAPEQRLALPALGLAAVVLSTASAYATEPTPDAERRQAAEALASRAEAGDPEAIAALLPLLHAPDSRVRYHAHWGLARAGEPAVLPLLGAYRSLGDEERRARVARVFGSIGLPARPALPEMRLALSRPDSAVAGPAAAALGAMRAREALPDLVAAYAASPQPAHQRQMIRAMRRIGSDQAERRAKEELVDTLSRSLGAPDVGVRHAALARTVALYRIVRDDRHHEFPTREELRPLVPGMIGALDDPAADTALLAIRGIALAGADAAAATDLLEPLLAEPDTEHGAREALEAIDTPEAREVLEGHASRTALAKRIRTEYAPADDIRRTRLLPFWVLGGAEDGVRLEARFLTPGRTPTRPRTVVITFESYSPHPRLIEVTSVEWHADEKRVGMPGVDHSWSRTRLGVMERLSGALSVEDFTRLAAADRLEVRLGDLRLRVSDTDRMALRHLAAMIPVGGPTRPAARAP